MRAILRRAAATTLEQRKLLLSLGTNFATRLPGAAGVIFFLPLLRFGLGTADYSLMLAALALGSASSFLFGGIGTVARRRIGEAYSLGDRHAEASTFRSISAAGGLWLIGAGILIALYAWWRGSSAEMMVITLLPVLSGFFNIYDQIRAAYNEHYITASLQFTLQLCFYAAGFLIVAIRHDVLLAALVIQGPYLAASMIAAALLLRKRAYLLGGATGGILPLLRQALLFALVDGFLMTSLSITVVLLEATEPAATSAWFATLVRLFTTFLVPVVLLILPLSSYVRVLWVKRSPRQQQAILRKTLAISAGYSLFVAIALYLVSRLYIEGALHLPAPGGWHHVVPIFAFFAGIVVYKSYASIAYMVLDANRFAMVTIGGLASAAAIAGVTALFATTLVVIDVYALLAAFAQVGVLLWSERRFAGETLKASAPSPIEELATEEY